MSLRRTKPSFDLRASSIRLERGYAERRPWIQVLLEELRTAERHMLPEALREYLLDFREFEKACLSLDGEDAVEMAEIMQDVLDITDHAYEHRGVVFKTLNGLCKSSGVLVGIPIIPSIKNLAFVASGGFGEIFKGHTEDGDLVAIKTIRFFTKQDNPEGQKSFRTEILLYRQVRHRHILPLIGITDPEFSRSSAQMVIPWKANGNLLEYVKRVESPPLTVNRLKILVGVCSALCYLHSHVPVVVHGDLKCANVLVDDDGTPLLADFGLSTVRYHGASLSSAQNAGTLRWMAPELLTGNPPKISRETDAWSFGMLALEIFTGQSPYSDKCDYNVTLSRAQGELPKRPSGHHIVQLGLNQELWTQLRQLWSFSPEKRPKFTDLAPILDRLEARWSPPSPTPTPQKYITNNITIPPGSEGRFIGPKGAQIDKYRHELKVEISVTPGNLEIHGLPENVTEARARLKELAATLADRVEEEIPVSGDLHKFLIGPQGSLVKLFSAKHGVRVDFHRKQDAALICGSSDNVRAAAEDLRNQIRIIEKQQLFCSELQVDVKTASRLATCKDEVRGITGAQRIDISPTSTNSNRQSVCLSGTKEALSAATDKIRQIERAVLTEKEVSIVIPSQSRSIIIGPQWQTWSEIVLRCGGPSDLQAQKNIIEIDPSCDVVRLRGTPSILDKLTAEIKARTKTVYAVRISNRWHRKLFPYAKDIAHSTETTILFPGHDAYHSLGEPANVAKMQGEVKSDIVKFYGTISGYEAARRSLESHLRDLKGKERTISVPSRYEHAVYECVFAKLSARGVTISPILNSQGYFPDRPMGATSDGIEEVQWNVVDRWRNLDSNSTWTLAARDKQDLPRAVEWINESLQQLWEVQRVGFLTLLDRSKFSLIVGPGGQTVTRIQQETGAIVRVPSNRPCDAQDRTITIIGSDKTIEEARQRIMRIVDSTPRRRKGSIASIDPVRAAAMSA